MKNEKRKNATTSTNINDEQQSSMLSIIEKRTHKLMIENYKAIEINYNILVINNLLCNGKCHIVALFKEHLINDDNSEFLKRYYTEKESLIRIKKVARYYFETSVIFPNYTPLNEAKYIYKNIMRKQKVIDEQQELEEINEENKKRKNKKNNIKKVFDTFAYDDILNQSESIMRILFGINKKEKNNKSNNENNNNKNNNNENNENNNNDSTNNDNKSYEKIENLIEKIQTLEKKQIQKKPQIKISELIKKNLQLNIPKKRSKPKIKIPNSNIRTMMEYKNKKPLLTIQTKSISPSSTHNKNNKSSSIVSRNLINNFTLTSNSSISVSHNKTKSTFSMPKIYFATQRKKKHNLLSFKSIEFNNLNNGNDMLKNFFTSTITSPRKKIHKKIRSVIGRNYLNNIDDNNNSIYSKTREGSKKKKSFQIKKLKELDLMIKSNGVFSERKFDIKK